MPMNLLSAEDFRAAAKDGAHPEGMLFRFAPSEPETIGDATARVKRFVFSDASVDLAGDSIKQDGWDLKNFEKNPVALFSHTSWEPPIGRASNVGVKNGKLIGDIEFADAATYDFADVIYRLVDGGYLKAVSVGFMPTEWSFTSDKERPYGIDFKKQSLLEISICAVPCNPNALQEARSAGIDTRALVGWAEKVLDSGDTVFLPRKELEALRLQAKEAPRAKSGDESEVGDDPAAEEPILEPAGDAKAMGEGDGSGAGDLVGAPLGSCGRDKAEECGMKDPQECAVHFTPAKSAATKAGRRISAATMAKLQAAKDMADAHHAAMTECITAAMGEEPPEDNEPNEPPEPAEPIGPDEPDDLSPEQRRLREAQALRASLPKND